MWKPGRSGEPAIARILLGAAGVLGVATTGCYSNTHQDTLIQSRANPSHTYRATVVIRQYYVDGKFDTSPTTFVLLDPYSEKAVLDDSSDFKDFQVVIKPSQCGPLRVEWSDDRTLKIICDKCGIALSAVGQHPSGVGSVRVEYEGFPDMSSWEGAPHSN